MSNQNATQMSNSNNQIIVAEMLDALESNDLVLVTFKTKTNTLRVMGCTRLLAAVPTEKHHDRFEPALNNRHVACIYDFQNAAWRAFRKDSVISFQVV